MSVVRAGSPVALPQSKRARALLAYLRADGRRHRRERLCAMLWELPDDPRAALRWSLSRCGRWSTCPSGRASWPTATRSASIMPPSKIDLVALRSAVAEGLDGLSTERRIALADTCRGPFLEASSCRTAPTSRPGAWPAGRGAAPAGTADDDAGGAARRNAGARVALLRAAGPRSSRQSASAGPADGAREPAPGARAASVVPLGVAAAKPPPAQQVRFCRTRDGVRIAYATAGSGPPLVRATHWLNHVEFERESPVWKHWTEAFAGDHTFIRYDDRGGGLSDWDVPTIDFEGFVQDLEAVVDALGLKRFPLIGSSKGGPIAIAYAARHPERVSRLILLGTLALGWRKRGDPRVIAMREAMITLTREGWAQDNPAYRQLFTTRFMPGRHARGGAMVQRPAAPVEHGRECHPHHRGDGPARRHRPAAAHPGADPGAALP
jgi:pimeloyl-ACP methyl ester carboxylesterase